MDGREAIDRAKAIAGGNDDDADDNGNDLEQLQQKHHDELTRKELMFRRAQHEKIQAHMAMQAAKILQFHSQHGDQATHQLAKGLLVAQGPDHLKGIGKHLWQSGAQPTAKILLDHAASINNSGQ